MIKSENRLLIIGASSDLAQEFISSQKEKNFLIDGILRNKNKLKNDLKNRFDYIFELDLNDLDNFEALVFNNPYDKIVFFQGVDILKPFSITSFEDIIYSFNVNIISTIMILRLLIRQKRISKNSSIVILSSIAGLTKGAKGHVLYSTTKSSISGLVKSLSLELAHKGIRINSISPGLIRTDNLFNKNKDIISTESLKNYESNYPLGLGGKNCINGLIKFLLSKDSSWITGQNYIIDGGVSNN